MKIIYFIDRISTPGGMERILTAKVNMLSERGYQIGIITNEDGKQEPFYSLNKNVKVFYLNMDKRLLEVMKRKKYLSNFQKVKSLFKKSYDPQYAQKVIEILNQEKPDICVELLMMSELDNLHLRKIKDGSKKIVEFHFSRKGLLEATKISRFPRLTRWYFKNIKFKQYDRVAKKYDAFVVLTHQDKISWKSLKNAIVIPNFTTFRTNEDRFPDYAQKIILSVGKIHYQKGFDLLIKAWSILEKKYPDWQLRIIDRRKNTSDNLDEIIDENNLKNVQVLPAVKNIEQEYYKSSIYAGTSRMKDFLWLP